MPRKIRLLLEYDGSGLMGWQRQRGLPTVQGELERALEAITQEPVAALDVRAAGRTDAGVHAMGQVVTFATQSPKEARRFAPALNHFLPAAIRVHVSDEAPPDFSPRHSAVGKTYLYTLFVGPHPSALYRERAWHVCRRLDLGAMQQAAGDLVGEHDFESFRSAHCDAPHARRHLRRLEVAPDEALGPGRLWRITLEGNAFCRHMCRILVGTLVEVGSGRRAAGGMGEVLAARDRQRAGETAPGLGLCLAEVAYPPELSFGRGGAGKG